MSVFFRGLRDEYRLFEEGVGVTVERWELGNVGKLISELRDDEAPRGVNEKCDDDGNEE